jgi:hypothetical protein
MRYALIEPVLENSFQKNSEVRISAAVPLLSFGCVAVLPRRQTDCITGPEHRQVLTDQGFSAP